MAYISEIHYQNSLAGSTGQTEYVEVILTAAEAANAANYTIATYQLDGTLAASAALNTLTPVQDPNTGVFIYQFATPVTAPNHSPSGAGSGEAEAVALVNMSTGTVISFVDIGGGASAITAVDGPAAGATSQNITGGPGGGSIQFNSQGNRVDGPLTQGAVACFTAGTLIETRCGGVAIEALRSGDTVLTQDGTQARVLSLHRREVSRSEMRRDPSLRPVRLNPVERGEARPLLVSSLHRIVLTDGALEMLFGATQMFARADHLAEYCDWAERVAVDRITYYHLLLDGPHRVIRANGQLAESFFPGDVIYETLDLVSRDALWGSLRRAGIDAGVCRLALPELKRYEVACYAAHHARTKKVSLAA